MKKSLPLTCAQLGAAIAAVENAGLYREGPAMRALNALLDVTTSDAARDSEPLQVAEGPLPVTVAQVEQAIAEASSEVSVDAGTLRVLKRARDLLARAERVRNAKETAAAGAFITRAEFEALLGVLAIVVWNIDAAKDRAGLPDGKLGFRLERVVNDSEAFEVTPAQQATLKRLMDLASAAGRNAYTREMRHSRRTPGQPWSTR